MNIVLLTENWPPRIGGIENYLFNIIKHLAGNDIQVTVIAPKGDETKKLRNKEIKKLETRNSEEDSKLRVTGYGLRVTRRKFFWPLLKPAWLPLYFQVKRLHKNEPIDVLLCGKGLFEGLLGYYVKKRLGVPYIVFTYAMEIEEWMKKDKTKRKLTRVIKEASRIVYINDTTKQSLLGLGARKQQLVKLWPALPTGAFGEGGSGNHGKVLAKYNIQQPYIISVGRLIPRKGFDDLIEAFSNIDQTTYADYSLVIAGDGQERRNLESIAKKVWLNNEDGEGRVKFTGYIPDEDLRALLSHAEIFALTPKVVNGDVEGFGIVYLEASAVGLPVIATRSGGAKEAVVHKETGIVVEEGSTKAIRKAIEFLLSHKDEAAKMGERGKKRAYDQFRWSKRVKLVKDMIHEVLGG